MAAMKPMRACSCCRWSAFCRRTIRAYAPVVYLASLVGLIAVLVHGQTINGSHSWIHLPAGFEVQPSEFAKIALIVLLAMLMGERRDGAVAPDNRDVCWALGLTLPLSAWIVAP